MHKFRTRIDNKGVVNMITPFEFSIYGEPCKVVGYRNDKIFQIVWVRVRPEKEFTTRKFNPTTVSTLTSAEYDELVSKMRQKYPELFL